MSTVLYGLPNCDGTTEARRSLERNGIRFSFHDIRVNGMDAEKLRSWIQTAGWEKLLNKKSTTWKQLADQVKNISLDNATVHKLIIENITLMKRPVLEAGETLMIGKEAVLKT